MVILGDMFELGDNEIKLHKKLYSVINQSNIDSVFTIGNRMKNLNEKLKKSDINIKHFNSRNALKTFLNKKDFINSVILVKGSRGMKMEEFVHAIEVREL